MCFRSWVIRMKNKYMIITVMLLVSILASSVLGDKIVQTSELTIENDKLIILYPNLDEMHLGKAFTLRFHVLNSTGYALNTSEVNCSLHIYNIIDNSHIFMQDIIDSDEEYDFYVLFNSSYFNETGGYEFNLWCISSKEAGYVSSYLEIRPPFVSLSVWMLIFISAISVIIFIFIRKHFFIFLSLISLELFIISLDASLQNTYYYGLYSILMPVMICLINLAIIVFSIIIIKNTAR